jgi:hypothetical protein
VDCLVIAILELRIGFSSIRIVTYLADYIILYHRPGTPCVSASNDILQAVYMIRFLLIYGPRGQDRLRMRHRQRRTTLSLALVNSVEDACARTLRAANSSRSSLLHERKATYNRCAHI